MHSTNRVAYSSAEPVDVKIDSLYLDGAVGRVIATIDERMLSLETKTGHALDIKVHSINRVHHHHTRLIPFSFATIGLGLIWSSIRIFSSTPLQIITMITGLGLIIGWAVTRKPTLTIDTEVGDCHVITGSDYSLLKLNTILMRLQRGFKIHEAITGLEILNSDAEYPRNALLEPNEVPVNIVEVSRPESIASFLSTDIAESVSAETNDGISLDMGLFDLDTQPEVASENLPSWLRNPTESIQNTNENHGHSLIQKGIENVGDRRNRQVNQSMPMFNQIDVDLSIPQRERAEQVNHRDIGLLSKSETHNVESGPSMIPDLLPNFCNKEGFHIPNQNTESQPEMGYSSFASPDSLLGNVDDYGEPVESLVASARKSSNQLRREAHEEEALIASKSTRLRKKSILANSRLVKRRPSKNKKNNNRTGRLIPTAGRIGNSIREVASSISNRIINTLEESTQSETSLRERSNQGMEMELETFSNLAHSNGGHLPDEKVREMEEHVRRRKALLEQNQQEIEESDDTFSFGDLIDSDTHKSSTAGKGGLPRIDV